MFPRAEFMMLAEMRTQYRQMTSDARAAILPKAFGQNEIYVLKGKHVMACVRRQDGFVRYAFAVSYYGGNSLGFTYQGSHGENAILSDGTDLRGLYSIQGRIRRALTALLGKSETARNELLSENNFENFQVSSRTDRGVHALKNTFHLDVRPRRLTDACWSPQNLIGGINFHLVRLAKEDFKQYPRDIPKETHSNLRTTPHHSEHDVRILSCRIANHLVSNNFYQPGSDHQPEKIDWNARFTATSRTYCYRILHMTHPTWDVDSTTFSMTDNLESIIPFETGRSWIIRDNAPLNIQQMQKASTLLVGKHDFSSFRAKGCERASPMVQINYINITSKPLLYPFWFETMDHSLVSSSVRTPGTLNMITITIQGEAFLYRQIRNMVGCLIKVGQDKLSLEGVSDLLAAKDRRMAPSMAPAHGLYLIDVSHNWDY